MPGGAELELWVHIGLAALSSAESPSAFRLAVSSVGSLCPDRSGQRSRVWDSVLNFLTTDLVGTTRLVCANLSEYL